MEAVVWSVTGSREGNMSLGRSSSLVRGRHGVAVCLLMLTSIAGTASGQAKWKVEREEWELKELANGPISGLTHAAFNRQGELTVYDSARVAVIAVGQTDGKVIWGRFGARENGYTQSVGFIRYMGDTLVVYEERAWQLIFIIDGKIARSESLFELARRRPYRALYPFAMLSDGSLLALDRGSSIVRGRDGNLYFGLEPTQGRLDASILDSYSTYVRFVRPDLVPPDKPLPIDTVAFRLRTVGYFRAPSPTGRGGVSGQQPWLADDLFAVSPVGDFSVYVTRRPPLSESQGTYTVVARNGRGKVYDVAVPYTPVPLGDSIVDDWISNHVAVDSAASFSSMAAAYAAVKEALTRPKFVPPVREVLVASDGCVWLERNIGQRLGSLREWSVLDPQGRVTASVTTPWDIEIIAIGADRLWALESSLDGTKRMVRYRIKR
jgi:hypothetical protein